MCNSHLRPAQILLGYKWKDGRKHVWWYQHFEELLISLFPQSSQDKRELFCQLVLKKIFRKIASVTLVRQAVIKSYFRSFDIFVLSKFLIHQTSLFPGRNVGLKEIYYHDSRRSPALWVVRPVTIRKLTKSCDRRAYVTMKRQYFNCNFVDQRCFPVLVLSIPLLGEKILQIADH